MALLPRCYTAGRTRENGPFLYPSHQKFATNYSNHPVKFELSKEIHPTGQVGDAKSFNLWQCGLIETPELSAKHNIPIPLPFLTKSGMGQECWQICTHLASNVMQDQIGQDKGKDTFGN